VVRFDIRDEESVKPSGSVYRHLEESVAIFSSWVSANIQVTLWQFFPHFRGNYRFRVAACGYQTDKPVTFHMTAGTMKAVTEERIVGYHDVPPGKPTVLEFVEKREPRNTVRFVVDNLGVIAPQVEKVGAENYKGPGLAIQRVEVVPLAKTATLKDGNVAFLEIGLLRETSEVPETIVIDHVPGVPPWRTSRRRGRTRRSPDPAPGRSGTSLRAQAPRPAMRAAR
jgi:hypothetical protein